MLLDPCVLQVVGKADVEISGSSISSETWEHGVLGYFKVFWDNGGVVDDTLSRPASIRA